ncbi:MAG: RNA polymerase sigma factor [Terriglobales bacterium]
MAKHRNPVPAAGLSLEGDCLASNVATAVLDAAVPALDVDTALMLRFQAGEESCYEDLVARFRRPLLSFLVRMTHDAGASEELLQEAFLRVYLHRGSYRPQARFSTWMYRITHRLALNYLRDHRHEFHPADNAEDDPRSGSSHELADQRPNVEQNLLAAGQQRMRRRRVLAAITALPERQRTAVILNKYQGMDYEQIGEVLQFSSSATKSVLFRAYQTLRQQLKDLL